MREDIGRHNAVDKVVGRLLLDGGLPATDLGLYVSGRAGFEIVQKAWAAGFGAVVSVSAPSALAVDAARQAGITLVGFVRASGDGEPTCNLYSAGSLPDGLARAADRLAAVGLGRACGRTASGCRSPTTTGTWPRWPGPTGRHPKYALDVLTKGVCDGCALGVAGLHDWTIDGVHLCTTRLNLLELNTADPFDPVLLADVAPLRDRSSAPSCARLGRLGHPMRRRRGEPGFRRIDWAEALDALAGAIGEHRRPTGSALYLTSRGITNETYYVAGKAARAMGIAGIDSAARVCHAPSTVGLKETIGVAASTCSLQDVIESDLVVLWGTNPANNQPVFMKYLYLAKKRGLPGRGGQPVPRARARAVLGAVERWSRRCSAPRSATCTCRSDPAATWRFANAVLKRLIARGAVDQAFIDAHTTGWDDAGRRARRPGRAATCSSRPGVTAEQVDAFVDLYAGRRVRRAHLVDGHHPAPRRGRRRAGHREPRRWPAATSGATAPGSCRSGATPGCRAAPRWAPTPPPSPAACPSTRPHAAALVDAVGLPGAGRARAAPRPRWSRRPAAGELDVLWSSGGNFLEVLPDPPAVRRGARAGAAAGAPGRRAVHRRCSWRATT